MRIQRVFFVFFVGAIAALGLVLISDPASVHADECTWIVGRVGVWSDGNNWTCGFAPDSDDTAILSIGTVNLDSDVTVFALDQSGGTVQGPWNLTVTDSFIWTRGTQEGFGSTTIAPGAVMTLLDVVRGSLYERTLENWGTVECIEGGLILNDGATVENRGTFEFENDDTVTLGQGVGELGTFWNRTEGAVRKAVGDGDALVQLNFHNEGLVEALAGVLRQGRTGTVSNSSGEFSVGPSGSLQFTSGSHTLLAGSSVHGDGLVLFGGAVVIALGDYNLDGITAVTGGSISFDVPASTAGLLQWGGTLAGGGTVTVTGAFNWTAGTQTGTGATILAGGASTVIEGTTYMKTLDGRILENWGDLVWVEGTIYGSNGATIDNWGEFVIQAHSSMTDYTGEFSTFWNQPGATVRKEGVDSVSGIRVCFRNAGLVEVLAGRLDLEPTDSANSSSGEFYVGPSGILNFDYGTHSLEFSSLVHGEGTVQFNGADVTVLGNYDVSGPTDVILGTATFDDARSVAFGDLSHTGGVLNLDTQVTVAGDLNRRYGQLHTGTGTITFNGTEEQVITCIYPIHFYILEIDGGATVMIPSGSLAPTVAGTLTNDGTMKQTLEVDNSGGGGDATFSFLNIEDGSGVDKYHGLDITIGPYANMGTTQVSIQGNQTCGSTNTVERCYEIDPLYEGVASRVRFYYRAAEANGNMAPYAWHWNGSSWDNVDLAPLRDTTDPEGNWVEASGIVSYSPFALSDEEPLPEYEGIIFVKSITLKSQPNGQVVGTVRIIDDDNSAVAGATVSVEWTGPNGFFKSQDARTTKPGTARFRINPPLGGEYVLCVVDVSLDDWLYDPDQNQETCESIVID